MILDKTALTLAVIGALNWGGIGLFGFAGERAGIGETLRICGGVHCGERALGAARERGNVCGYNGCCGERMAFWSGMRYLDGDFCRCFCRILGGKRQKMS